MRKITKPDSATPAPDNEVFDSEKAGFYLFGQWGKRTRLEQWRHAGIGPPYIKVGPRVVRYRRADLDAYIQANMRHPGSDAGP